LRGHSLPTWRPDFKCNSSKSRPEDFLLTTKRVPANVIQALAETYSRKRS